MKKYTAIITTALALAMLVSCNNNTAEPAVTTTGTVGITGGASPSPTETTVMTTVEETEEATEETTTDVDSFDVEGFLNECTVYDVTTERESYLQPLKELQELDDFQKPEKIALRFTDAEGLVLFMEISPDQYVYSVKYITNGNVSVSMNTEDKFFYMQRGFFVKYCSDVIIVQNGEEAFSDYYVFKDDRYTIIENYANVSGYTLDIIKSDAGEFLYYKYNWKYAKPKYLGGLVDAYESDADFYRENGKMSVENGEVIFDAEDVMTVGEWYQSDFFPYKNYRDKHGAETFREFAEIFKQYVSEGRENEF
ncbi:MAG: hypothetical protein E7578_07750 [Ruminococcaceae bacterium]|nr:hypothetical protein [Oscillospiraceae bacterium]